MNRYQLEFAELDRRQRVIARSLSVAGAGLLMVAALWSAGLPPNVWFGTAENWIARLRGDPPPAASTSVIAPAAQEPLASVAPNVPPASMNGTDSSLSSTPLPLYLLSAAPGRNFRDGTAQIGTSTTNPQTYAAGALLANGAKLAEIHRDFVVLTRGERYANFNGEWNEPSISGQFSVADTFLYSPELTSRQIQINGQLVWGGHLNYIAVGMLAAHYGPNMYQSIPALVAGHNVGQATGAPRAGIEEFKRYSAWNAVGAHGR